MLTVSGGRPGHILDAICVTQNCQVLHKSLMNDKVQKRLELAAVVADCLGSTVKAVSCCCSAPPAS